jgi:hypothetical protein
MEFLALLYLANFVASVAFVFLQQQWSLARQGDAQQLKEKTVILPPFWATRPAVWCLLLQGEGHHLSTAAD